MSESRPEVWLRGPLPDYIDELQPVAHSLLQVREEIEAVVALPADKLWARPGGAASIGFHLKHLAGSLDRLLTYASGRQLSAAQRRALADEEQADSAGERADTLVVGAQAAIVCRPRCSASCFMPPNMRSGTRRRSSRPPRSSAALG